MAGLVFYVVNLVGVRPTAAFQVILVTVLIAAIVLYALLGIGHLDAARFVPTAPRGTVGVLAGGGILFGLMAGASFMIDVASGTRVTELQLKAGGHAVVALSALIILMLAASLPGALLVIIRLGGTAWLYWRRRIRTSSAWSGSRSY